MSVSLPLSEAGIISTTLQGMLYGASVLMFVLTFWILRRNHKKRGPRYGMAAAAFALLILSTAEFVVNIIRLIEGLLTKGPKLPLGLEFYFADVTQTTFVTKGVLYNLQTLVLDGVVIYRAYVVWQKLYVVIVPIMGWFGLAAMTIGANMSLAQAKVNVGNVFAQATGRWLIAIYATTLGVNLLATGLLAYRIWAVHRRSQEFLASERRGLNLILRIIIESGAIYSVTILCALVTFIIGSPGVYVILDLISPIISIVFNMIIVRIAFASEEGLSDFGGRDRTQHPCSSLHFAEQSERRLRRTPAFETKSLAIKLTQYEETDVDTASVGDKRGIAFARTSSAERSSDKHLSKSLEP